MKLTRIDIAMSPCIGPVNPSAGITSRGRRMIFAQKTPSGGIQAVLRIRVTFNDDCDTYSTHPLQNIVSARLRRGVSIQPKRAKPQGIKRAIPKLKRVIITPWTIPKVMRSAY